MAMLGLIDGANSGPQKAQLSAGGNSLLNNAIDTSKNSAQSFADSRMGLADPYSNSLTGGDPNAESARTGGDPYFMKAARDYYGSKLSKDKDRQKQVNDMQMYTDKDAYIRQYQAAAQGQALAAANAFAMANQAHMASERARANLVNSLFQTANVGMGIAASNRVPSGGGGMSAADNYQTQGTANKMGATY